MPAMIAKSLLNEQAPSPRSGIVIMAPLHQIRDDRAIEKDPKSVDMGLLIVKVLPK